MGRPRLPQSRTLGGVQIRVMQRALSRLGSHLLAGYLLKCGIKRHPRSWEGQDGGRCRAAFVPPPVLGPAAGSAALTGTTGRWPESQWELRGKCCLLLIEVNEPQAGRPEYGCGPRAPSDGWITLVTSLGV
jgi:hypothetical protein